MIPVTVIINNTGKTEYTGVRAFAEIHFSITLKYGIISYIELKIKRLEMQNYEIKLLIFNNMNYTSNVHFTYDGFKTSFQDKTIWFSDKLKISFRTLTLDEKIKFLHNRFKRED